VARNFLTRILIRIKADRPIWIGRPACYGLCVSLATILVWWISQLSPEIVEQWYSRGLYPVLVTPLASATEQLDAPLSEGMWLLLVLLVLLNLIRFWIWPDKYDLSGWRLMFKAMLSTLAIVSSVFALMLVLWGFNYFRQPVDRLFQNPEPLSQQQWQRAISWAVENTNETRSLIRETVVCQPQQTADLEHVEEQIKPVLAEWLQRFQLPVIVTGKSQYLVQSTLAKELGVAGFYNPLLAQPNVGQFMHPLLLPFTVVHERAHLNGFAHEDSANLIAYLSLWRAEDPLLRYSAWLQLWRTLGSPEQLDSRVHRDLDCIRRFNAQWRSHPMKDSMWQGYDRWLKSVGNEFGVGSYDRGASLALQQFFYGD
jgi:hypothetical protein